MCVCVCAYGLMCVFLRYKKPSFTHCEEAGKT